MSGPRPQYDTPLLFSLIPMNKRAEEVVKHPANDHLVTNINGRLAIGLGFHIRSKSCGTLATLGRGDTDVFVGCPSIARIQCSFEIDPDTGEVMLYDRSMGQSTQVHGEDSFPFEYGRLRRILVANGVNSVVGMGGAGRNLVLFKIKWLTEDEQGPAILRHEAITQEYKENPRLARTVDDSETTLPSRRLTRLHTPGTRQLRIRFIPRGDRLGVGQFGTVLKAIDVDTAEIMAVKILHRPEGASTEDEWRQSVLRTLKREVEILSQLNHPHIVDYIASQGWEGPQVEIFMGLKEGTLESLVKNWKSPSINTLTERLVHQMLQALDCLSAQGIVHRDVKPDNILYVSWPDGHHFQLGDFGLSNRAVDAKTFAGTPRYMAPEMFRGGVHSHKADVWSLFVTTVWMLNPENFREEVSQCVSVDAVYKLLSKSAPAVINIQEMGRVDPEERASAAQMLIKLFNGEGLTTPRNAVQAIGAAKASVQASPPSTTSQPIRRVSPGSCLPQRTGRFHIERLRGRTRTLRQDIVSGQHPK